MIEMKHYAAFFENFILFLNCDIKIKKRFIKDISKLIILRYDSYKFSLRTV